MAEKNDWVSTLRGIIEQMSAANVRELELQQADLRIRLRRPASETSSAPVAAAQAPLDHRIDGAHRIVAPLTGVFYSAPSPGTRPYVEVGDWLQPDTLVGLIETMKVFNEVVADCQGRVVAILAQQGQLIHSGEAILVVDVNATPDQAGEVVVS
jgi:acetyl-CoA carboxylase biotin carboxyl carrier protein